VREIQIRIGRAGAFRSEFRGLKGIGDGKPCVLVGFPFPFLANFTAPCQSAKGHQAIALAMIYPDPEKGGRGKKAKNFSETEGFSAARLSQARSVLRNSRPLVLAVLAGGKPVWSRSLEMVRSANSLLPRPPWTLASLGRGRRRRYFASSAAGTGSRVQRCSRSRSEVSVLRARRITAAAAAEISCRMAGPHRARFSAIA